MVRAAAEVLLVRLLLGEGAFLKPAVYTIYRHVHRASQKCYVGQTKHSMEKRWKDHVRDANSRKDYMFQRAIRKYGPESFDHEVLEVCTTSEAANEAEQWWIAHFGSNDPTLGYNLESGGGVGKTVHPETRAKIGKISKAAAASKTPEQRRAQAAAGQALLTPERRAQITRDWHATQTPEQRSARLLAAWARRSPEWKSEFVKRRESMLTNEQKAARTQRILDASKAYFATATEEHLRARAKKREDTMSEDSRKRKADGIRAACEAMGQEWRTARVLKGWETRRANGRSCTMTEEQKRDRATKAAATMRAKRDAMRPSMRINLLRMDLSAAAKEAA